MSVTTVLASIVTRRVWGWSPWRAGLVVVPLLAIDLAFFGSNLLKVRHGGWFPLLVAGVLFVVMLTWDHGRAIVTRKRTAEEGPLRDFIARLNHQIPPVLRAHGTAVYLNARTDTTPLALRYNVRYNQVRHEHVVIFRAVLLDVPHVREQDRVRVDDLGDPSDDVTLVTGRFGYRESPDVPAALAIARERSPELRKLGDPTYFLSRIILLPVPGRDMALWRKRLFAALARNAASPSVYFGLPHDAVISIDGVFEI
jgi:KUP system potassium uptake protein